MPPKHKPLWRAIPQSKTALLPLCRYKIRVAKLKDYRHLEVKSHSASKKVPPLYATLRFITCSQPSVT
jgi:hypothetical protein